MMETVTESEALERHPIMTWLTVREPVVVPSNSTEYISPYGANIRPGNSVHPDTLWNKKVHHRVLNSSPLKPNRIQLNSIHYFQINFCKAFFITIIIMWVVRLLALRPLLAYCVSLG
jgi:hypothetical protein